MSATEKNLGIAPGDLQSPHSDPTAPLSRTVRPKLLVSVRCAEEAQLALAAGVAWIDVKNPDAGSLGRPSLDDAARIAELLAQSHAIPKSSIALGELHDLQDELVPRFSRLYPICKVGTAGCADEYGRPTDSTAERLRHLAQLVKPSQLVIAAYADRKRAKSPTIESLLNLAGDIGSQYLLIDTFVKDGLGLLQWIDQDSLLRIRAAADRIGIQLVLAGSLTLNALPELWQIRPSIVAVRGAVCEGDRTRSISAERLQLWVRELAGIDG